MNPSVEFDLIRSELEKSAGLLALDTIGEQSENGYSTQRKKSYPLQDRLQTLEAHRAAVQLFLKRSREQLQVNRRFFYDVLLYARNQSLIFMNASNPSTGKC